MQWQYPNRIELFIYSLYYRSLIYITSPIILVNFSNPQSALSDEHKEVQDYYIESRIVIQIPFSAD